MSVYGLLIWCCTESALTLCSCFR